MGFRIGRPRIWRGGVVACFCLLSVAATAQATRTFDQGGDWTDAARLEYHDRDQGSRLIPLAWLNALRQANGAPFLENSLARYGYLPRDGAGAAAALPIGFTAAASTQGTTVGLTCAACHVRAISVGGQDYRIDGAPALADFGAFAGDLDAAVHRLLLDETAFRVFAGTVLTTDADNLARDILHAEVRYWWTRFHALFGRTLPGVQPWGPGRLDANAMIFNTIAGLDVGPAPLHLIPDNIAPGDAPVRYPFLWNAEKQDFTGWTGTAENGNAVLALARSLAELYGTFGAFRPMGTSGSVTVLDRNYLTKNSADVAGLRALDALLGKMGPPRWPWPVDAALAARGRAIFDRPTAEGGCAACHSVRPGLPRPPSDTTWATTIADVGTDTRAWAALHRSVATGAMAGASIPGLVAPLKANDLAFNLVETSVLGTIIDIKSAADLANPLRLLFGSIKARKTSALPPTELPPNRYEARVLAGVWAAAPYLHNGSVATLADLLEPAARRAKTFKVGSAYDTIAVGLAIDQTAPAFTMHATGCEARDSGDSDCGHEFGTTLPEADKKALLEYMKAL